MAEPHSHIGKERKSMSGFYHGYHGEQYRSLARTHDDGDDGVAQHGGHTPNNRLTETCSLGLLFTMTVTMTVTTESRNKTAILQIIG